MFARSSRQYKKNVAQSFFRELRNRCRAPQPPPYLVSRRCHLSLSWQHGRATRWLAVKAPLARAIVRGSFLRFLQIGRNLCLFRRRFVYRGTCLSGYCIARGELASPRSSVTPSPCFGCYLPTEGSVSQNQAGHTFRSHRCRLLVLRVDSPKRIW